MGEPWKGKLIQIRFEKTSLDGILRRVSRRRQGQAGDPSGVLRQKHLVVLGSKYRRRGCHLGKPVLKAGRGGPVSWDQFRKKASWCFPYFPK